MSEKSRSDLFRLTGAFLLLCLGAILSSSALAQTPPQITGTTTQVTTKAQDQEGPAISGNLICYTDYVNSGEVYCHDLATNLKCFCG